MGSIDVFGPGEEVAGFFAPASTDFLDALLARYTLARRNISEVAQFAKGELFASCSGYFLEGNATEQRGRQSLSMSAQQLFEEDGAVHALNASFWSQALALTDVYDAMPQARRDEWNKQIRNPAGIKKDRYSNNYEVPPLPDFDGPTVRATLKDLLLARDKFFAERVDGIFRALSGEHVTNSPAAFGKRLIIAYLVNSYGSTNNDRVGFINDLRNVIAKFMGRGQLQWNSTSNVVTHARKYARGEWVVLDGGALRLRAYKCGTAHLEVHPDMAWRLNCVLAQLYPMAIPPEFRQKPKKKTKEFVMMSRPLPIAVVEVLDCLRTATRYEKSADVRRDYDRIDIPNALSFNLSYHYEQVGQQAKDEAERILVSIGGVKTSENVWQFDYYPNDVVGEIVRTGCLPDVKAHQYYPTPANVAEAAIELAMDGATPGMNWLEPSAGQGGLADLMPKDDTACIEISELHCKVLEAKGHTVTQGDFLQFSPQCKPYDRIVMNPPYSEGRWQEHTKHAASMVRPGGRLVAILPSSAKGKDLLPGFFCEWSRLYENEFSGTSVSVVILTAVRQ